jgi:hypothetical protein
MQGVTFAHWLLLVFHQYYCSSSLFPVHSVICGALVLQVKEDVGLVQGAVF